MKPSPPLCRRIVILGMLVTLSGLACDDASNDIPQAVRDQQARQAEAEKNLPKIPTTQDLVTGPRSVTPLGPLPLTMRVPASWKVEVTAGASLLRGFTPNGEIAIQLSSRPSVKKANFDGMFKSEKKEQAEKPQAVLKLDLRPFGDAMMYERQSVGDPAPFTVYDHNLKARTTTEQIFKWTISVLAPTGDAYQRYDLNFVGLTKSQYDQDKEFLQGILSTLTYGNAGASTASPVTTAPGSSPPLTTSP